MHGKLLGTFRVESTLGSGGMGTVYRTRLTQAAYECPAGSCLAVKIIHPHLLARGEHLERFHREARVGSQIRHENVVEVFGAETAVIDGEDVHFLVMAEVAGRTLRDLLNDLQTVPETLLREIGSQVAAGLAAIHDAGIVHRDLKPENVILTEDDQIRIMDLGLARLVESSVELTIEGHFAGSLLYAAPEQFENRRIGPAADLYSLGVLLYELATGINPFRRDVPTAVMLAHLQETPTPLCEWNPQVSALLSEVVMVLLKKAEGDRLSSAAALRQILLEGEKSDWWAARERDLLRTGGAPLSIEVHRDSRLLGRDGEMAELIRAFQQARAGEGNAVLLMGETGIGKTRLIDEFLREDVCREATGLYGAFFPLSGRGGISEAILSHLGSAGLEEALRPYLAGTPSLIPAYAAQVKEEGFPIGINALAPEAAEALTCQLMRGLAEEGPILWVIDDLHFAEPSSRKVFLSMARAAAGHRVLLLATSDVGIPKAELALFDGLSNSRRLTLGRLGARDVVELIRETFKSDALTDRLGAKIAYKSDGVPFFVFEIIRGLKEQGLIEALPDGTSVETEVIDRIEVPSAVRDLIEGRLRELSDEDRSLLDVASVIGHRFDPDLVARVREVKRVHVLERLAAMERRSRVVRNRAGGSSFDHHQIRELIYEDLIPDLRAEYHTLLADALLRRDGAAGRETSGETALLLARHHLLGVRKPAGLPHLTQALEFLSAAYRNEAILDLAGLALREEGLLTGPEREDVLHRTATSLDILGRRDEERTTLEEIVHLADEGGDAGRRVRARRRMGWNLLCVSRPDEARTWLTDAAVLAEESGDRVGYGLATLTLGNVFWSLGRYEESREHYARARTISAETGDRRMEARARGNLANVARLLGRHEEAREHLEEASAIFREIEDRTNEGAAEGNLGNVFADLGRYDEAGKHQLKAILIAREIGDRPHEGITLVNRGAHLLLLGDPTGARETLLEAGRILKEIGTALYEGYVLLHLGEVAEADGDGTEATNLFTDALDLFRAVPHPSGTAAALLSLGGIRQTHGDPLAASCFKEAVKLAQELGEPTLIVLSLGRLATLPGCDPGAALKALDQYDSRLPVVARMKARFLIHVATGEPAHLREARRLLQHLVDHAPEESRESMVRNVPLHREIMATGTA